MFKCEVTGKMSNPGEKCNKIVTGTREKIYYKTIKNEETLQWEEIVQGIGWEIVSSINATDAGVKVWQAQQDLKNLTA